MSARVIEAIQRVRDEALKAGDMRLAIAATRLLLKIITVHDGKTEAV